MLLHLTEVQVSLQGAGNSGGPAQSSLLAEVRKTREKKSGGILFRQGLNDFRYCEAPVETSGNCRLIKILTTPNRVNDRKWA